VPARGIGLFRLAELDFPDSVEQKSHHGLVADERGQAIRLQELVDGFPADGFKAHASATALRAP
jgi:hypothetical protein